MSSANYSLLITNYLSKMKKFEWQGKHVKATFGRCVIPNKPTGKWYGYELSLGITSIPAIKISSLLPNKMKNGEEFVFIIANFCGVGFKKITSGGWPDCTHYSFDDDCKFIEDDEDIIVEFDENSYKLVTENRDEWYKNTMTWNQYERRKALLEIAHKNSTDFFK